MSEKVKKIFPVEANKARRRTYENQFNKDGTEKLDFTPVAMPIANFDPESNADVRLQQMLELMLQKRNVVLETVEDDLDYEIEEESTQTRYTNFATKEDLNVIKEFEKQQKKEARKRSVDKDSVNRKSAKTDRGDRRVDLDQGNKQSASDSSSQNAADE